MPIGAATAAAPFAEEPPSSIATTTTRSAAVSSGIAAVRTRAGSRAAFQQIIAVPLSVRGARGPAIKIGRPHSTSTRRSRSGGNPLGRVKRPITRRSWRRARVMKGSSPSPRSSCQLADTSLKATGASATVILCRWQKSRM